jgi:hypothetical protein
MGIPIEIPRILGISWWWLLVVSALEGIFGHFFPWYGRFPFGILNAFVLYQALWLKRAEPQSRAIYWYVASALLSFVTYFISKQATTFSSWQEGVLATANFVIYVYGIFKFKWEMENHFTETDPVGLNLSGVMTFFFSNLYFQYHFHEIYLHKRGNPITITPFAA